MRIYRETVRKRARIFWRLFYAFKWFYYCHRFFCQTLSVVQQKYQHFSVPCSAFAHICWELWERRISYYNMTRRTKIYLDEASNLVNGQRTLVSKRFPSFWHHSLLQHELQMVWKSLLILWLKHKTFHNLVICPLFCKTQETYVRTENINILSLPSWQFQNTLEYPSQVLDYPQMMAEPTYNHFRYATFRNMNSIVKSACGMFLTTRCYIVKL